MEKNIRGLIKETRIFIEALHAFGDDVYKVKYTKLYDDKQLYLDRVRKLI